MASKFIEPWILPPGIFILGLVVAAVLVRQSSRRLRRLDFAVPPSLAVTEVLLWGMAAALLLMSVPVSGNRVVYWWEHRTTPSPPASLEEADAVVVLGGGVVWDTPAESLLQELDGEPVWAGDDSGAGYAPSSLSAEAESRLLHGARIARRLELPLVVTGGRVLSAAVVPPEALVAAKLARDLGLPPTMIVEESDSRTTAENARRTADRFDFTTVVLVTSAYHMPRSVLAFESAGLAVLPAPAPFHADKRPLRPVDVLPRSNTLYSVSRVLREAVGMLWYRLILP